MHGWGHGTSGGWGPCAAERVLSSTTPSFSWCLYRREAMGQRVCSDTTGRSEGKGSPGPTGGSWAQRSGVWAAQSYPPTPVTDSGAKSGSGLPCCEDPLTRDTSIQNPLLRGVGWGGVGGGRGHTDFFTRSQIRGRREVFTWPGFSQRIALEQLCAGPVLGEVAGEVQGTQKGPGGSRRCHPWAFQGVCGEAPGRRCPVPGRPALPL